MTLIIRTIDGDDSVINGVTPEEAGRALQALTPAESLYQGIVIKGDRGKYFFAKHAIQSVRALYEDGEAPGDQKQSEADSL